MGKNSDDSDWITPTAKPPTTAPATLPRPPSTTGDRRMALAAREAIATGRLVEIEGADYA